MSNNELIIDQAGASGPVAEKFRRTLAGLDMQLGDVATAHPEFAGARLGDYDPNCPEQWADKRLISLEDLAVGGSGAVVFSGLKTEPAAEYEDRLAKDRLVVTNASANRMREDVALTSAFVNPNQIDELYEQDLAGRIIAGGNCLSAIVSVPLAPIHKAIGIEGMHIETLQGWSGAGVNAVPNDVDEIAPIAGDEQDKIETEPKKFLGSSLRELADIAISARPNRGPWLRGHHAKITARLARDTSKYEIEELWRQFRAPEELEPVKAELRALSQAEGHSWPKRYEPIKPVKMLYHDLVRFYTKPARLTPVLPMRVKAHVIDVSQDSPNIVTIEAAGDNLMQGAVGGNLLNAIYARAQGYI